MKTFRYLTEAALVHCLITIFRLLPVKTASDLGGWIGRNVAYRLFSSQRAARHLRDSLQITDKSETKRIIIGMWDNLGRVFAEYPHIEDIYKNRLELVGAEHLQELTSTSQTPAIFFSGHLANWEIAGPAVRPMDINVDLIYRPPNNPYVKKILDDCRSIHGELRTYPKSSHGMRQVMSALKDGRRIGILIDQKYNQGVEVPFFGRPAMASLAFIHLAKRFNCPLFPVNVERITKGTDNAFFRVTIYPRMDLSKDDATLMSEAHTLLENWIRKNPAHWIWIHKRWKNEQA